MKALEVGRTVEIIVRIVAAATNVSSSAMPRAETGGGVSAVRSIGKASAAASDVNALHRALGCLSASGEIRSMYFSSIVIVAGFGSFWNVWALRAARFLLTGMVLSSRLGYTMCTLSRRVDV